jgi:Beta xylosidase C-terminal Concanavalin A-like domain
MFLRKQTHRFCKWETRLSFLPSTRYTEAGTVVWMDYFTHCSIGIRLIQPTNDEYVDDTEQTDVQPQRSIRFSPPIGSGGDTVERKLSSFNSEVIFQIECGNQYRFSFREVSKEIESHGNDGDQTIWIGEVTNEVMTRPPPIGAQFTGVMLGLYAFGEHHPCSTPADFHYVNVTNYL